MIFQEPENGLIKTETLLRTTGKLLLTLIILLVIKLGADIPVPGINYNQLFFYLQNDSSTNIILRTLLGNKSFVMGLFTLNIFPYINASILMQVLISVYPKFSALQKEGIYGKRELDQTTRILTLIFALVQSSVITLYFKNFLYTGNFLSAIEIIIGLTTGAMIIFWLSEFITEYGLGNGASLLVSFNIVTNWEGFINLFSNNSIKTNEIPLQAFGIFFIALLFVLLLQQTWIKIPLISAKLLNASKYDRSKFLENEKNYLPLRYDNSGILPLILTTSILYWMDLNLLPLLNSSFSIIAYQIVYWIIFFLMNGIFNSILALLTTNPTNLSNDLQENAVTIQNLSTQPLSHTFFYLKSKVIRNAFAGSIFLSIVGILSNVITTILPIAGISKFGLTSLFILVNVIAEVSREVQDIVISRVYNDNKT